MFYQIHRKTATHNCNITEGKFFFYNVFIFQSTVIVFSFFQIILSSRQLECFGDNFDFGI